MDLELSGKRALVTGSTAGIGTAIARQLASEDAAVVIHGRDELRGARLAAELTGAGRRAIFVGADLLVQSDIARLASRVRDRWDEIEANILESYLPIPAGHIGTADDVARVAVFLASPNAAFVNGAVVRVDGGSYSWAG